MKLRSILTAGLVVALGVVLAGCFEKNTAASQEPPPPPTIYTVKQTSKDGLVVLNEDTAVNYYVYGSGGCISYTRPNTPKGVLDSLLCGGIITIVPQK